MARYPQARWRPVHRYQPGVSGSIAVRMRAHNRLILHTAVSGQTSLYSFFSRSGTATSHFYVAHDGTVEQYIDTAYRSTANLEGNPDSITVETQDIGGPFPAWDTRGSNVPAWTAAQVAALVALAAWAHRVHGIPLTPLSSSRPGTRGVGYHRQGVDPWRVSGGELWSKARGKVCPGDRRVAQIPTIISRASGSTPSPQEEDMTSPQDWTGKDWKALREGIHGEDRTTGNRTVKHTDYNEDWHWRQIDHRTARLRADTAALLENQVAMLAGIQGLDADAISAKLDAHHSDYLQRFEAVELRLAEVAVLLEQFEQGTVDAAQVVDGIRELFHNATAPVGT